MAGRFTALPPTWRAVARRPRGVRGFGPGIPQRSRRWDVQSYPYGMVSGQVIPPRWPCQRPEHAGRGGGEPRPYGRVPGNGGL